MRIWSIKTSTSTTLNKCLNFLTVCGTGKTPPVAWSVHQFSYYDCPENYVLSLLIYFFCIFGDSVQTNYPGSQFSGSTGPIFTKFLPNDRHLVVDCRSDLIFPIAQGTFPWQQIWEEELAYPTFSGHTGIQMDDLIATMIDKLWSSNDGGYEDRNSSFSNDAAKIGIFHRIS